MTLSRRSVLQGLKALAGASTINPSALFKGVATQALSHATSTVPAHILAAKHGSEIFEGIFESLAYLRDLNFTTKEGRDLHLQRVRQAQDIDGSFGLFDCYLDAINYIFLSDLCDALTDQELHDMYSHYLHGIKTTIEENNPDENASTKYEYELAQEAQKVLHDFSSPDEIRHFFHTIKKLSIQSYKIALSKWNSSENPYSPHHDFKDIGIPWHIRLAIEQLSLEDQLRLISYAIPNHITLDAFSFELSKSMKPGVVSHFYDIIKAAGKTGTQRLNSLDFVLADENDILTFCRDFVETYVIDQPYTLRELKQFYDAYPYSWGGQYLMEACTKNPYDKTYSTLLHEEPLYGQIRKILTFYGVDPDAPLHDPHTPLHLTMKEEKRPFFSSERTFSISLILDGLTLSGEDTKEHRELFIDSLNELRHDVFEILTPFMVEGEEIDISTIDSHATSLRVTVQKDSPAAIFMEQWMNKQNTHDDFWDQEIPNEFLFDVEGYIAKHTRPAPTMSRAAFFGRRPEL